MSDAPKKTLGERISPYFCWSLATWISIGTGLALTLFATIAWLVYNSEPERVAWSDYLQWSHLAFLVVLVLVICTMTYWTIRFWSEDLPARDEALEHAWNAGWTAITHRGWKFQQFPFFLVLGCTEEDHQRSLIQQSGCRLVMEPVPTDPTAPIRWFIAEDRVFLFCGRSGTFGMAQNRLKLHSHSVHRLEHQHPLRDHSQSANPRNSIDHEVSNENNSSHGTMPGADPQEERSNQQHQTTEADVNLVAGPSSSSAKTATSTATRSRKLASKTDGKLEWDVIHKLEATEALLAKANGIELEATRSKRSLTNPVELISSSEQIRLESHLEDLCLRIKASRAPVAPINGVLVWVKAEPFTKAVGFSHAIGKFLRLDLEQLHASLGVQAPVTIALDGMQELPGFQELIRRTGRERAKQDLLGESFPLNWIPNPHAVRQFCKELIATLSQSTYRALRTSRALNQPGNQTLFQLILVARGPLLRSLLGMSVESMAKQPSGRSTSDHVLFNGIFFTATGKKETEQAFIQPVFERMMDQQEMLGWTSVTKSSEHRYRIVLWILQCLCALFALLLVFQLLFF